MFARTPALPLALVAAALFSACGTGLLDGTYQGEPVDDFTSASVNGSGNGPTRESAGTNDASAPSSGGAPRTVEEGDVYKVVGDTLYVLNMYRGLQIIDVTNPDAPVKRGTSPVLGYPVEMYVRDGYAYVIVSDYFTWQQGADGAAVPFHGSQVRIVDVRQPDAPVVVGGIDLDGAVSDTRIVGEVLYTVANRWAWYNNAASTDTTDALEVSSIDLSQRAAPVLVETLSFPGTSNVIHVSPTTLYVASPDGDWNAQRTNVTIVDIDDPAGDLEVRGSLSADGRVDQRFQLDEYNGYFRLATHSGSWGNDGSQLLSIYTLAPQISLLSTLSLPNTGGLFATRFEGERAYLVTMVSIDPLEVIDLRDPALPVLTHSLVIPGVIQQIVPRGDRLLALGTDDRWSGVAASLFDVSNPQAPTMLARVQVGGGSTNHSWSNATWDDKALRVLDADGMMLVPFSAWQQTNANGGGQYVNGFQIVSFTRQTMTADGVVEQAGQVSRVTSHRARLLSISDRVLQAVDATDRRRPRVTAALELARDVTDFAAIGAHAVTLSNSGWWWSQQDSELRVATLASPEDGLVARLALPFYASKLIPDGTGVIVLGQPTNWDGTMRAARVDLTTPALPVLGPVLTLGTPNNGNGWSSFYLEATKRVSPGVIALPAWISQNVAGQYDTTSAVYVADLARQLQGSLALPDTMAGELVLDGANLWTSHSETTTAVGGLPMARYYADRIDLTDPANPRLAQKVNVPGTLVGVSGDAIFTRDYQWQAQGQVRHSLAECQLLPNGRAVLRAYLTLDEGLGRIIADGRRLYATTQPWWWSGQTSNGVTLRVYASSPAAPLAEVSRTPVRDWLQLRALAGGHLFLGSGYWGGPWEYGAYGRGGVAADVAIGPGMGGGYASANGLVDLSIAQNPDQPAYRQFIRTSGWVQGLEVANGRLYVSGGMYGIASVALTP